jgi:hypothetical protein
VTFYSETDIYDDLVQLTAEFRFRICWSGTRDLFVDRLAYTPLQPAPHRRKHPGRWAILHASNLAHPRHTSRCAVRYFGRWLSDHRQSGFLPRPIESPSVIDRHLCIAGAVGCDCIFPGIPVHCQPAVLSSDATCIASGARCRRRIQPCNSAVLQTVIAKWR